MNITAINGVKATTLAQNSNHTSKTAVSQKEADTQYKYSGLDKMGALGKSLVHQSQKRLAVSFTGWAPEAHNKATIERMAKIIKDPSVQKIAVSGHTSPDGDSFGTTFAMANLINQATGKKVDLFVFGNTFPEHYKYLNTNPDVNVIIHKPGKYDASEKAAAKYGKYDLAIACDCAESKLMAGDYKGGVIDKAKYSFKIDHHPYKEEFNEKYGRIINNKYAKTENLIDDTLPAAAEITMQFVEPLGLKPEELRKETKEAMFTGILTDTGCFKYANTPLTFEDAALLMKAGVNNREVNLKAMGNTPKIVLDTEKLAWKKVQYSDNGKIAYVIEDNEIKDAKKACKNAGYEQEGKDAIKHVCGRLPEINGVEVGFKVYEFGDSASISIRSRSLDVSEIARKYGGGGHKNAAAFQIQKNGRTIEETVADLVKEINTKINNK